MKEEALGLVIIFFVCSGSATLGYLIGKSSVKNSSYQECITTGEANLRKTCTDLSKGK